MICDVCSLKRRLGYVAGHRASEPRPEVGDGVEFGAN